MLCKPGQNRYNSSLTCDTIFGMAHGTATITELRLEPDGIGGKITCPAALRPDPGQYLAASSPESAEALPVILYPTGFARGELSISGPLPAAWKIGMKLHLRGPLGKGFHMPVVARRVALACLKRSPARLLPLAYQALAQGAAVTIYAEKLPPELPPEIEILPIDLLPEAPEWADFLALEVDQADLPDLRRRLGLTPHQRLSCLAQVLIVTSISCAGLADCGICAVLTRAGWSLACEQGPVYEFNQLELSG